MFLGYETFKNGVFRAEDADQRRVLVKHVPGPRFELYTSKEKVKSCILKNEAYSCTV